MTDEQLKRLFKEAENLAGLSAITKDELAALRRGAVSGEEKEILMEGLGCDPLLLAETRVIQALQSRPVLLAWVSDHWEAIRGDVNGLRERIWDVGNREVELWRQGAESLIAQLVVAGVRPLGADAGAAGCRIRMLTLPSSPPVAVEIVIRPGNSSGVPAGRWLIEVRAEPFLAGLQATVALGEEPMAGPTPVPAAHSLRGAPGTLSAEEPGVLTLWTAPTAESPLSVEFAWSTPDGPRTHWIPLLIEDRSGTEK